MSVKKGDNVRVHYTGKMENGEVFDTSIQRNETLDFEVGSGSMIHGFDKALLGMVVGDKKVINIPSEEAYGDVREELIQDIPSSNIPENATVGTVLEGTDPNGNPVLVKVLEKNEETSKVDFNHPLAGHNLTFEIELVEIKENQDTES